MFADACERAARFTRPVIISTRQADGKVTAGCGAFVVLNEDGWIVTAGHIFDSLLQFQNDQRKMEEVSGLNASLSRRPGSPAAGVRNDPSWLTNHSFWWGHDGVKLTNVYVNRQIDVALGRMEPFDPAWIQEYPVFKDAAKMRPGTSLCRLGFPFINVESEFDPSKNAFRIKKGVLPMPLFPNDGIHTRNISRGRSKDGNYEMLYVETSSPGLKGQSGGPIYDKECRIAGIQVQTAHLPLGFHPSVEFNGEKVTENQFLNVGVGIHVKTLTEILRSKNIRFLSEGEESGYRITE
ncbi:MAG: trypsin-like peptidase domain-containing protein [Candidatus Methanomethylophilaceae archaeon]|jgi:hypothetical protein|nr:trypsin-like peptidase domain-containing protein [Candidatus Methanomethylophilaceae archaeon]